MNDRLDYLLSVEIDDELDAAEREELDQLLLDHPEAAERRASFGSINAVMQAIGSSPTNRESGLDAGLDALRARIEQGSSQSEDDLAARRRARSRWIPSVGLAAAAAMAVYFVIPQTSPSSSGDSGSKIAVVDTGLDGAGERGSGLDGSGLDSSFSLRPELRPELPSEVPSESLSASPSAARPGSNGAPGIEEAIALAVVFELDEDSESNLLIDSMSAADFEIVEQLELLEFLAARESEGGRG